MSLSARIFLGLGLGIITGLFFGDLVADLKVIGDIFIKMLQITVLPYIVVSLIAGIGRMHLDQAQRLAVRGSLVLLGIWGLALIMVFVASLAFPDLETSSFFSHGAAPVAQQTDLVDLYLPSNIFYSLANNLVPAVVFFSLLMGVALISVEDKTGVLPVFDALTAALAKINTAIVRLTPYGIFAISAAAAGTMTIEEVSRVQVYLLTYISLALLITFWIFPGMVAALSGIPFKVVLRTFKDALVTAFATGNQFVVLPQIAENCKTLLREQNRANDETDAAVDIIVPVSFNFPSLGKLLVILFVLFAAWFTDTELGLADRLSLAFNGLFSLFGSINIAVPYMLDSMRVPADMFQLFLVTGIVVGRFGAMLAALHIIVISIIGTLALVGGLKINFRSLLRYLGISALSLVILIIGLRGYFLVFVPESPPRDEVLASIELMEPRVEASLSTEIPEINTSRMTGSRLDHILQSGVLQVGYLPSGLPCTFVTPDNELVGFDVEMAHILAEDIGVKLEFVPFEFDILDHMLNSGQIDMAMSCIAGLPDLFVKASFSKAYIDLTLAAVVPDHERHLFSDHEALLAKKGLKIALVNSHYLEPRIHAVLPDAEIVMVESAEDFFNGNGGDADALMLSAEEGAAYTYRYPHYTMIKVRDGSIRLPAVYAVPKGDIETMEFVSNWVDLKRKDGTIDKLYGYWMLGGAAKPRGHRWSIIRDVLGWVD